MPEAIEIIMASMQNKTFSLQISHLKIIISLLHFSTKNNGNIFKCPCVNVDNFYSQIFLNRFCAVILVLKSA